MYRGMLYCFSILFFCMSFMFANTEQSEIAKEQSWLDKTRLKLELLLGINHTPFAKCEEDWQKKVCDGSIMCYATKCFYYEANISMMHRIFLENLIKSLKESYDFGEQERASHLSHIAAFGLPEDTKQHDFVFINSNNVKCTYTLWQKDEKTLFFDISGCLRKSNQRINRTLIQHDMGIIELYEHIAY